MPLPNFLQKIFGGGATELLNTADKLIDNLTLSKEEKEAFKAEFFKASNEHIEKMAGMAQSEMESYLKDIQDARATNVQIQNSEQASWLAKNVAYCIDVFIIAVWGFLTIYLMCVMLHIVKKNENVDYTAVTAVWGGVTAFAGTIMNFHRGSSVGSKASNETLRKMVEK